MATHHGNEGVVKVGSNAVAELQEWSIQESADTAEDHSMGDTWKSHKVGHLGWQGRARSLWDETDTNGQQAMTIGASITLNCFPEGDGAGDTYYTGTASVTGVEFSAAKDGIVAADFTFTGNGALSKTTV